MKEGIEGLEKIIAVGDALCDSITAHRASGESWGTWDFVQDVGPDLVAAVSSLPDLKLELRDLDLAESTQLVEELAQLLIKTIGLVSGVAK